MCGRDRDAQHADDSHHHQPGADLDHRVSLQRTQCRPIACAKPRGQDQPIDRGEREHRGEQRELGEQQHAVAGAEQRRDAADQEPAVADAAQDQHAHAYDRQTGKAPGCPCRILDRLRIAQHVDQCRQRAQPRAGTEQMHDVRNDLSTAPRSFGGGGVPGPREGGEIRACDERRRCERARTKRRASPRQGEQQRPCETEARDPHLAEQGVDDDRAERRRLDRPGQWKAAHGCGDGGEPRHGGCDADRDAPACDRRQPSPHRFAGTGVRIASSAVPPARTPAAARRTATGSRRSVRRGRMPAGRSSPCAQHGAAQ